MEIKRPDNEPFVYWENFQYPWLRCPNCGTEQDDEISLITDKPVRYCSHCGIRIKPPDGTASKGFE